MPPNEVIAAPDNTWLLPLADWITPHGLRDLPDDLPYDDWAKLGLYIGAVFTASKWAIGDWLAFGEHHYPDRYTQAAEATGRSEEGLMVLASVSRAYSGESAHLRHRKVPFSTHQDLASLARSDPDEADSILARAEDGHWTVAQTREELRPSVQAKPTIQRMTIDEFEAAFERWPERTEHRNNLSGGFAAFLAWLRS